MMTANKMRESTLVRIENAINEIYSENPGSFKLNFSEIQRRSGISRPTLSKIEVREHIESYIGKLPKAYSMLSDQKSAKEFENDQLREKCRQLQIENRALLSQLADLFYRIYGESIDASKLLTNLNTED